MDTIKVEGDSEAERLVEWAALDGRNEVGSVDVENIHPGVSANGEVP